MNRIVIWLLFHLKIYENLFLFLLFMVKHTERSLSHAFEAQWWNTLSKKKKRVKNTQSPCFFSKIEKLPTIYRQLRNWWRKVKHCWFLLSGTRKEQRKRWLNRGLESSPTSAVGPPISGHQGMTAMLVIRDGIIVKTNTESLAYTLTSTLLA